jgi:hypothetical protein
MPDEEGKRKEVEGLWGRLSSLPKSEVGGKKSMFKAESSKIQISQLALRARGWY